MQAYQLSDSSNINETGPTKKSLRVADQFHLSAEREVDLEDNPLLRSIGNAFEVEEGDYPQHILDAHDPSQSPSASGHANATSGFVFLLQPELHDTQYGDTIAHSESSHGKSFSIFTDEASSNHHRHDGLSDVSLFEGIGTFPERAAESPIPGTLDIVDLERPTIEPDSRNDLPALFPWRMEFSWAAGQLAYAGDPLTPQPFDTLPQDRSTHTDDATVASHLTHVHDIAFSDEHIAQGSSTYSQAVETGSDPMTADAMTYASEKAFHNDLSDEVWYEFRERVISILNDHFWRTHTPQQPNKQTEKSGRSDDCHQPTKPSHNDRVTRPRGSRTWQHRKSKLDESEDEDPEDGHQHHPTSSKPKLDHDQRRVDCPFYKNYPLHFRDCRGKGFRRISDVKQHLKLKHQDSHCSSCFQTMRDETLRLHQCTGYRPKRVLFLTQEALIHLDIKAPNEQGNREERLFKQWVHVYKIIFPNDAPPFPDPFVEPHVVDATRFMYMYLQRHLPKLWPSIAQNLPQEQFFTPGCIKRAVDQGVGSWVAETIDSCSMWDIHGDINLGISSSCDSCQAEGDEQTTRDTVPDMERNQQNTYAGSLVTHQNSNHSYRKLHNDELGRHDGTPYAINQSASFPVNTFPAEQGFNNTLLSLDNSNKYGFDSCHGINGMDQFNNTIPTEPNLLPPPSLTTFSNEISGPWYPGVGPSIEDTTLALSNGAGSAPNEFFQGFDKPSNYYSYFEFADYF